MLNNPLDLMWEITCIQIYSLCLWQIMINFSSCFLFDSPTTTAVEWGRGYHNLQLVIPCCSASLSNVISSLHSLMKHYRWLIKECQLYNFASSIHPDVFPISATLFLSPSPSLFLKHSKCPLIGKLLLWISEK